MLDEIIESDIENFYRAIIHPCYDGWIVPMRQKQLQFVNFERGVVNLLVDLSFLLEFDLSNDIFRRFSPTGKEGTRVRVEEDTRVFAVGLHELLETPVLSSPLDDGPIGP